MRTGSKMHRYALMRHNCRTIPGEFGIATRVIAMKMREHKITDGLGADRGDRGFDLVVQWRVFIIHHDDAVIRHRNDDVSTVALKHVGAVAEIGRVNHRPGEIGWWRGRRLERLRQCRSANERKCRCGGQLCERLHGSSPPGTLDASLFKLSFATGGCKLRHRHACLAGRSAVTMSRAR